MVKADAYGHGLVPVARAVENLIHSYGVATLQEGVALRKEGIRKEILLLAYTDDELDVANDCSMTLCVGSIQQLERLAASGLKPKVHLKLNTGMNRFGLDKRDLARALEISEEGGINVCGCYSHLRRADAPQYADFDRMRREVQLKYPSAVPHLCSSSSLNYNSYKLVRVGLAAYENAMTVVSQVVEARELFSGDYLGYGSYILEKPTKIAWIFGGYADGIMREKPQNVYIRGVKCRTLLVCMDVIAVETPFLCEVGESVILQNENYSAAEIADDTDTIPYTALTGRQGRIQRIYYDESGSKKDCES